MLEALDKAIEAFPFPTSWLDCDNGSEFINDEVVDRVGERDIFFTRSRPYRKNDQAIIESKNNHVVRCRGFDYRYDTAAELSLLNQLWLLVADRGNYFVSTKKPAGWGSDQQGRRKRLYDKPVRPLEWLLGAGVLSPEQQNDLEERRRHMSLAELTRDVTRVQSLLIGAAKDKTDALYAAKLAETSCPQRHQSRQTRAHRLRSISRLNHLRNQSPISWLP